MFMDTVDKMQNTKKILVWERMTGEKESPKNVGMVLSRF
jgi:hypothetical protein